MGEDWWEERRDVRRKVKKWVLFFSNEKFSAIEKFIVNKFPLLKLF